MVAVDDDRTTLRMIEKIIARRNLACRTYESPLQALENILSNPPSLVIIDFDMPEMSGIELCRNIRKNLGSAAPACVMLSATDAEEIIEQAFEAGAIDYICKPFSLGEFNAKIMRVLRSQQGVLIPKTQKISDYRIIRRIAQGGMGVIFEVECPRHPGKRLALKKLILGDWGDDALARFQREIDILIRLKHPNLVRIYEAGESEGQPFYTMDFINGASLGALLEKENLSFERIAVIADAIADVLQYLHDHDVIHRDVSPGNILLGQDGAIQLADFGLAKHQFHEQLTRTQEILGTPNYMSPEMIAGHALDHRADLFSLGMVTLTAILGENPVHHSNPYTTMNKIMHRDFPRASQVEGVPEVLGQAVDKLLELKAEKRTQSAREFRQEIAPLLT